MEFIALLFLIWVIWVFARFCGWVFNGPRYRMRRARKYMREDLYRIQTTYENMWYSRRDPRRRW